MRKESGFILDRTPAEAKALMDEKGLMASPPPALDPTPLPEGIQLPATHIFEEALILQSPMSRDYDEDP